MLESSDIYKRNKKVLIPNKYYCDGYFEVFNIFKVDRLLTDIKHYFNIILYEQIPEVIITIGVNCKKIINDEIENINSNIKLKTLKHFHIETQNMFSETFNISVEIQDTARILIFTDVIGSSETLKSVLKVLHRKNIIGIFSIINTNEEISNSLEYNLKEYNFESLVYKPIKIHKNMPKNWVYSEVSIVDTKSNRIIENQISTEGPLWLKISEKEIINKNENFKIFSNIFLENIVGDSRSVFSGHFVSRNNHLTCLFNIPLIINKYSDKIGKIIIKYINNELIKINSNREPKDYINVRNIVYPDFNPGLDRVASSISKQIMGSTILSVNEGDMQLGISERTSFKGTAVIILDDAFISGNTIERLIDIVENNGASHIFIFVLIKRGNNYQARKFEKLKQYGQSTIQARYLVDAEIPIFKKSDCPICYRLEQLEIINKMLLDFEGVGPLLNFVETKITQLRSKNVSAIFCEDLLLKDAKESLQADFQIDNLISQKEKTFSYSNIRWKLELAIKKENINMRKDLSHISESFSHHPDRVLLFLKVLSDEFHYFLINEKNRNNLLYSSFENNLKTACRYFLNDVQKISVKDLYNILNVVIEIDEQFFVKNINNIIINNEKDLDKLCTILLFLFLSKTKKETPLHFAGTLKKVLNKISIKEMKDLISSTVYIFDKIHEENQIKRKRIIDKYAEIEVQLHSISQRIKAVKHYLEKDKTYYDGLQSNYKILAEQLNELENSLSIFMNSLLSKKMYNILNDVYAKLSLSISELSQLPQIDIYNEQKKREMKLYLERIYSLLLERTNPDSLNSIRHLFRVDIKKLCYQIIDQHSIFLKQKQIKYNYDLPDETCLVFGEDVHITEILGNLVENVCAHSTGNNMLIKGVLNNDKSMLTLFIMDNGEIEAEIQYGNGLKSVTKSANICGGDFIILRVDNYIEMYPGAKGLFNVDDFRTIAQVSLPTID